jgi:uncharacterized protein (DUF488 family)
MVQQKKRTTLEVAAYSPGIGPELVDHFLIPISHQTHDTQRKVKIATIGVYGWTLERFLDALADDGVELLVDVRQRRGVRGREYAWANAQRLQRALAEAGIAYSHHKELAPTTELRHLQYAEDEQRKVGKRERTELAPEYRSRYLHEIVEAADLDALVAELPLVSALFCVEHEPEACHRSLIADRLAEQYGVTVAHLR